MLLSFWVSGWALSFNVSCQTTVSTQMPCEGQRVTSMMRRKPPCALLWGKVLQELGTSRLEQLPKAHVWGPCCVGSELRVPC